MAGTAFWRFDVATSTLLPSDSCRALHGLASDAPFSFSDYLAAIHPDDRARIAKPWKMRSTRQAVSMRLTGSGGRMVCASRACSGDGEPGAPIEVVGASIDITD